MTTLSKQDKESRDFLRNMEIASPSEALLLAVDESGVAQPVFDAAKEQAVIVGSEVISFAEVVEAEFRQAIADSALVSQLGASAKVNAAQDPIAWFDAYFTIMGQLGWTTQVRDTSEYRFEQDGLEVHEAVQDVIAAFLGPIPGAAALIALTLKSLTKMDKDSPWITLFNKQSEHAEIGRFQFTLIRRGDDGALLADAMCFALQADKKITQVLFFKIHKTKTRLRRSLAAVSIGNDSLTGLRPILKQKIEAHRKAFILDLPLAVG